MTNGGSILLEGGSEFGGAMSEPDLCALERAGGVNVRLVVLPTAAAPDNNHERAGNNARRWFRSLGATDVEIVSVIDKTSANDASLAESVRRARMIYLLGGFPRHLGETLRGSRVWQAAVEAYQSGAAVGGSSAGAMVMCGWYYDPDSREILPGLDLLPNCCVLPHHDTFGRGWLSLLARQLPASTLVGIDERTGALGSPGGTWTVYGAGQVMLYHAGQAKACRRGETFRVTEG